MSKLPVVTAHLEPRPINLIPWVREKLKPPFSRKSRAKHHLEVRMEDNQKSSPVFGLNGRAVEVACPGPLQRPVYRRRAIVLRGGSGRLFDVTERVS